MSLTLQVEMKTLRANRNQNPPFTKDSPKLKRSSLRDDIRSNLLGALDQIGTASSHNLKLPSITGSDKEWVYLLDKTYPDIDLRLERLEGLDLAMAHTLKDACHETETVLFLASLELLHSRPKNDSSKKNCNRNYGCGEDAGKYSVVSLNFFSD